jgi:hypothetical protein
MALCAPGVIRAGECVCVCVCACVADCVPCCCPPPTHTNTNAARNSREAAAGIAGLSQALASSQALPQQQQLGPDAAAAAAQLLAGSAAAEVLPLLRAELAASVGPWLADSANAVKRLDTRLGVRESAGGDAAGCAAAGYAVLCCAATHPSPTLTHAPSCPPPQAVEGSLAGLEVSQSDGLMRLGSSISSSLLDAESSLQVGLGAE